MKPATASSVERRNARMHKIFETARTLKAVNAYPKLVAALRDCIERMNMSECASTRDSLALEDASALLRDLGE